ncbi:cytochrome P450 [Marasmius fiardii PR-910]|nr:cytochrome P450 [Marasmius fiardii PR-910]
MTSVIPLELDLTQVLRFFLCFLPIYFLIRHVYRVYTSSIRDLPGPPLSSIIFGNLREVFASENSVAFEKWNAEYGPTIQYRAFFASRRLYTTDLKALSHVLINHYDYQKPEEARFALSEVLGDGILITEAEKHKFQRKVMVNNPPPLLIAIRQLTDIFVDKSMELRDAWKSEIESGSESNTNEPVRIEVSSWLSRMTLDVIGLAGFNYEFNSINPVDGKPNELNSAFSTIFFQTTRNRRIWPIIRMYVPIFRRLPTLQSGVISNARNTMARIGRQLLDESKQSLAQEPDKKAAGRDLLSLLVESNMNEKDAERMSDEDVLAQVPTFLVAGHETTSVATTWALFALAQYPKVQRKLRDELLVVSTSSPSMDELNSLTYLDAVVRESLRFYSPVPATRRIAMKDDVIPLTEPVRGRDYVKVERGQNILINISILNRSKKLWGEDAREFKPERWLNGSIDTGLPGVWGNMMTFLGGARSCIGYRFSVVEMKALLFALVREFEFELAVPTKDIGSEAGVVQRPFVKSQKDKGSQLPLLVRVYNPADE